MLSWIALVLSSFSFFIMRLHRPIMFSYMSLMLPSAFLGGAWPCTWRTSSGTSIFITSSFSCCSASLYSIIDVLIVPVSSMIQECGVLSWLFLLHTFWNLSALWESVTSILSWLVTFILPLFLITVSLLSTSINLRTLLYSCCFLNLLARVLLCLPRELFPPDWFLHLESSWTLPPFPLDAVHCVPPVDERS